MIPRFQRLLIVLAQLSLLVALAFAPAILAQGKHHAKDAAPAEADATALMISDLHFDPFHDPGKAQQLANTPVAQWQAVLQSPPSSDQAQAFDDLQKKCNAKGVDTPYPLLTAAFEGMHAQQPSPDFITITGDLIAHKFDCRYKATVSAPTPQEYSEFVANTIQFVVNQLRATYPGVPIYVSLGNNDSDCGDYRLDPHDPMLARAAAAIGDALPPGERRHAEAEFVTGGYYSVNMAPPMLDTRIIVLNDIFFAPNYKSCSGEANPAPAAAEIAWLGQTLAQAHENGQNVWVIGHIPPGVNVYATMKSMADVCGAGTASMFMDASKIDGLLTQYSDIVRLGLFAHTHMDEIRLVTPGGGAADQGVPLKLVPSISPVDGNNPSFTIAKVEPATATVKDFDVFVGSNQTGQGITWTEDYDFDRAYGVTSFTAVAVGSVINQFRADPKAQTGASRQYIRSYFKGDAARELAPFWPQYTCSLANTTAASYKTCVCGAGK
ncbi:MAG TPA: metallophosphoesterase [Acidobacteriaceae bacterium]|nr:metallophosphoesterase [Acidobacteriaceae bacterium]